MLPYAASSVKMAQSFRVKPFLISTATILTFVLFYITSQHLRPEIRSFGSDYTPLDRWTKPTDRALLYPLSQAKDHLRGHDRESLAKIFNETLGFQAINLVSLPQRTDKRDAFAVAASFTGFKYNVTDGVVGSEVSTKALPYTMSQKDGAVGCWRAHLNVWSEMVQNGISSTLIFEDDADWDLGLRAQLIELAKGTRYILREQEHRSESPYGDDWDLLWTGHCGTVPAPWNDKRFAIPHDPTVVPPLNVIPGTANMSRYEIDGAFNTRVFAQAFGGICTTSYAISLRGARKALYRLSMQPFNSPVDIGLKDLCADKSYGFKCVAPYPQIIGNYRPPGPHSSWSDIEGPDGLVEDRAQVWSVAFSTKLNIPRLLSGQTRFGNSNSDMPSQEMTIQEITQGIGREDTAPASRFVSLPDDEMKTIQWEDGLPF